MAKPFESRIQDLVYNVDVGIGHQVTKILLYVLFVLGIAVLYQVSEFKGLKDAEAMDYAQLGRNLAQRGSLVTQQVRPASMWFLMTHAGDEDPRIMDHPDIVHPPVYPAILAAAFTFVPAEFFSVAGRREMFRPEVMAVLPVNHVLNIATGILVFMLGLRLFERRIALLAMTAFFLSDAVWAHSTSGDSVSAATFFVTATLYAAALVAGRARDEQATFRDLVLPVLTLLLVCALAFLTRYGTVVLVPTVALLLGLCIKPRGWAWAAGFVLAVLLAVSPWLVRNQAVSGSLLGLAPYTALNETSLFEEDSFERTYEPELAPGQVVHALQAKWFRNIARFYDRDLRLVGNGLFVCFFLTAFFFRFARRDVNLFRWCATFGMALLLFLAGYFGENTMSLLHAFLPVVLVYGTAFFFLLLDRLQLRLKVMEYGIVGIVLLLGAAPLILTLLPPRATLPYPPYFPPFCEYVTNMMEEDEWMCSDVPWATAWYGKKTSLQLPVTLDEFYKVNDFEKRLSGLYITTVTWDRPYLSQLARGGYKSWFPILHGQIPSDFPLKEGRYIPLQSPTQFFLTDRVRW